mmetsp:Transcript_37614/g.117592  ORF Transcript_37614/g.117592 Transcript_37614/m.117592 type:complete len:496 (+) Transcript_37614:132-1619(+)
MKASFRSLSSPRRCLVPHPHARARPVFGEHAVEGARFPRLEGVAPRWARVVRAKLRHLPAQQLHLLVRRDARLLGGLESALRCVFVRLQLLVGLLDHALAQQRALELAAELLPPLVRGPHACGDVEDEPLHLARGARRVRLHALHLHVRRALERRAARLELRLVVPHDLQPLAQPLRFLRLGRHLAEQLLHLPLQHRRAPQAALRVGAVPRGALLELPHGALLAHELLGELEVLALRLLQRGLLLPHEPVEAGAEFLEGRVLVHAQHLQHGRVRRLQRALQLGVDAVVALRLVPGGVELALQLRYPLRRALQRAHELLLLHVRLLQLRAQLAHRVRHARLLVPVPPQAIVLLLDLAVRLVLLRYLLLQPGELGEQRAHGAAAGPNLLLRAPGCALRGPRRARARRARPLGGRVIAREAVRGDVQMVRIVQAVVAHGGRLAVRRLRAVAHGHDKHRRRALGAARVRPRLRELAAPQVRTQPFLLLRVAAAAVDRLR